MRAFLAVFPPVATQTLAARVIETLRSPGDDVAWVKPDNLHYTLRFLGELDDAAAARAAGAAEAAARAHARFEVRLGAAGAFPRARGARVLWLGLAHGAGPFVALARSLEHELAACGFAPESRGFAPHLTLGRVRDAGADWSAALARVPELANEPAARFTVDAIACVASTLAPGGSRYRVWRRAPLGAGG